MWLKKNSKVLVPGKLKSDGLTRLVLLHPVTAASMVASLRDQIWQFPTCHLVPTTTAEPRNLSDGEEAVLSPGEHDACIADLDRAVVPSWDIQDKADLA